MGYGLQLLIKLRKEANEFSLNSHFLDQIIHVRLGKSSFLILYSKVLFIYSFYAFSEETLKQYNLCKELKFIIYHFMIFFLFLENNPFHLSLKIFKRSSSKNIISN